VVTPLGAFAEDQVKTEAKRVDPQQGAQSNPPLTPEQMALLSIQEEGQRQVAEVVRSMEGVPPGPALVQLQSQIVQIKMDTYVRFLTATAEFARARGDEPAALEAERIIEQVLHPQAPAEPAAPQPREKAAQEGGQR
jgi:hypothetical protein